MIVKMTRYDFILPSAVKDDFLDRLSSLGVVDITRSSKPVDERSRELLSEIGKVKSAIRTIESGTDDHYAALASEGEKLRKELEAATHWGEFDPERLSA
ncbi:MAG: hypothetical protein II053_07195, partial [Bacteroidales bacterium]|nr:hypothetical protein [Bacteroidales bacterium]